MLWDLDFFGGGTGVYTFLRWVKFKFGIQLRNDLELKVLKFFYVKC